MPGAQQPNTNPQLQEPISTSTPPAAPPQEQQQPPAQPAPAQTKPPEPPPATDDKPPEGKDWKDYARLWEQRAKENKTKADEWEKAEAAKRTKEEQMAIDLAQAQLRAEQAEANVIRERVARETGVLPDFLGGGTEEEMRAAAARALEWRGPQDQPPRPQTAAVPASTVTSADKLGHAPNGVQQLTREQFVALPPAERMTAVRAGQCVDLGIGKPTPQRRMGNQLDLGAHMSGGKV
jgi:hypothetical protein